MKRIILLTLTALSVACMQAQTVDPTNKYLVWTKNVKLVEDEKQADDKKKEKEKEDEKKDEAQSFEDKYFKFISLCDWQKGMRFMVLPEKKDLVIKTFTNTHTGKMVGNMALRHKIMEYRGHSGEGKLHERVDFVCVDDSTEYYYEVPTATFEDYCGQTKGIPTLAYLGDVDIAIRELIGKNLYTVAEEYNMDTNASGYGYEKISVPEGTPVKVVAIGVGTRHYPVKIIVEDNKGNQFFQNIAFSRTNSGLRPAQFEEDNRKHLFHGSFMMESDKMAANGSYKEYIGKIFYTLAPTKMVDALGTPKNIPRLSTFTIDDILVKLGTNLVTLSLTGKDGKQWKIDVTFTQTDVAGDIAGRSENYFYNLFKEGDARYIRDVKEENMDAIRKGHVRQGFTEAEVRLALGEPDGKGATGNGVYSWIYKSNQRQWHGTVFFWVKNHTVKGTK